MKRSDLVKVRITPEIRKKIDNSSSRTGGVSKRISDILEDFFSDKWERSIVEANFNAIGRIEHQLKQVTGDNEALFDLISLFIFQWCCNQSEVSPQQRQVQAIEGQKRYDDFLKVLKKIRLERKSFAALILEELRALYGPAKAA